MAPLNWRHRILIQSLLSRGPLEEDDFHSMFAQLIGVSGEQQEQKLLNEYVGKINSELGYVQLELRACRNQYDGRVYYGIVNKVSDQQSKLGTKYKVPQIAFYKTIVEAIIQDAGAEGYISYMTTLFMSLETQVRRAVDSQSQRGSVQIPAAFKNFSMPQKAKTLHQLVKDQWLCSSPEGKIGLGIRSFLDLRSWFRSNEVPACEICNEAAIKVEKVCPGCGTHLQIAYDLSPYSQPLETHRKRTRRGSYQEASNGHGLSPNTQPPETSRERVRHGSCQEASNAYGLSPNTQPLETSRKRTRRGSCKEASNAHGLSPNSQPLETSGKRRRRGSNREANVGRASSSPTDGKRRRRGSNREANVGRASSSPTNVVVSETKMVTRSAARSSAGRKMLKFYSL